MFLLTFCFILCLWLHGNWKWENEAVAANSCAQAVHFSWWWWLSFNLNGELGRSSEFCMTWFVTWLDLLDYNHSDLGLTCDLNIMTYVWMTYSHLWILPLWCFQHDLTYTHTVLFFSSDLFQAIATVLLSCSFICISVCHPHTESGAGWQNQPHIPNLKWWVILYWSSQNVCVFVHFVFGG